MESFAIYNHQILFFKCDFKDWLDNLKPFSYNLNFILQFCDDKCPRKAIFQELA